MESVVAGVPKILWMMWLQGYEQAPMLVKTCIDSWCAYNPDWQVYILDREQLSTLVDLSELRLERHAEVSPAAFSDIVRINLLNKFGGVWVDATCLCRAPLETWLEPYLASGFFAFRNSQRTKPLSSWFLAARRDSYIVSRQCALTNAYWAQNRFVNPRRRCVGKLLAKGLARDPRLSRLWLTPAATHGLRIYPYFWFHYIFCKLLCEDTKAAQLWQETPNFSAHSLERIQRESLEEPISQSLQSELDHRQEPLFKLNRRHEHMGYAKGSALDYVLNTKGTTPLARTYPRTPKASRDLRTARTGTFQPPKVR